MPSYFGGHLLNIPNYIYNRFIRKISKILNPYIGILLIQLCYEMILIIQ